MDILPRAQLGPAHFHTPSMSRLEFTALRITGKCGQTFQPIEGCSSKVIAFPPRNSFFLILPLYKLTKGCNVRIADQGERWYTPTPPASRPASTRSDQSRTPIGLKGTASRAP